LSDVGLYSATLYDVDLGQSSELIGIGRLMLNELTPNNRPPEDQSWALQPKLRKPNAVSTELALLIIATVRVQPAWITLGTHCLLNHNILCHIAV